MHWLTLGFIAAVGASTLLEIWLARRQVQSVVSSPRSRSRAVRRADLPLEEHRKAADYTIARVRFARIGTLLNAAVTLVLTVGGGIAGLDALWRSSGWGELWLGIAVVASVAGAVVPSSTCPCRCGRPSTDRSALRIQSCDP